jgi:hypothetical protein
VTPASSARSDASDGAAAGDEERFPAPLPPTGQFRRVTAAALTFLGAGMVSAALLAQLPAWLRWPLTGVAAFLLPQILMLAVHAAFGRWPIASRTAFPLAMAALLIIGAQQHGWPWSASAVMAGWFLLAAWPARAGRSPCP